jgi:hypothetical protein
MKTITLLMLLWMGALQAANLEYELHEQNQLRITPATTTVDLEFEHPEMILSFTGPCGSSACEVPSDEPLVLNYQLSGAAVCDGLDGNLEWQGSLTATDGPHIVNLSPLESNTQFTLLCTDAFGQFDIHQVDITVTEPSFCSTDVYPDGLFRIDADYAFFNDGFNFGESTNATFLANVHNDNFLTLSDFSFPQVNARRRIIMAPAPTNFNLISQGTISVSECPGDFSETATCVFTVSNTTNLFFSTKPSDADSFFCLLDPEQTYYINYITTPDPYNEPPECANQNHTSCAFFYAEGIMN